jgi:hypothetical protein
LLYALLPLTHLSSSSSFFVVFDLFLIFNKTIITPKPTEFSLLSCAAGKDLSCVDLEIVLFVAFFVVVDFSLNGSCDGSCIVSIPSLQLVSHHTNSVGCNALQKLVQRNVHGTKLPCVTFNITLPNLTVEIHQKDG